MAGGIEVLTRPAKLSYEEWQGQRQAKELWELIFPEVDEDITSSFAMDKFTDTPYGITYRDRDGVSHVRPYAAGTGYVYDVPRASEKTMIGEELRDAVITGVDPTSPHAVHQKKLIDDIVKLHMGGHVMTRRIQALEVLFDSTFYALGEGGRDIDLDIAFTRAAGNTMTHDFTDSDTQPIALKEMQDQLIDQGCSISNHVVIMGTTWASDFFADTAVTAYLTSNPVNELLKMDMVPRQLMETHGLQVVATYRAPDMLAPVWVCMYNPGIQRIDYKGDTASAWAPAAEACMFSLDSPRFHVKRGVDALDEGGKIVRRVGDVVFDAFHTDDPIADFIRSQTRHAFIPANTNHIVTSTGTFS
jgi:hypothetical protein